MAANIPTDVPGGPLQTPNAAQGGWRSMPNQPASSSGTPGNFNTPAIIPDAGVYGAGQAAAVNAYNNAVSQAMAQRNSLYNQYGLNNNGQVDPNNPYGQYQQMLGAQATQFQADRENSAMRNLGEGGLANQQLGADEKAANAQDWGFQQQVAGTEGNYQNALQNALGTEQSSIADAYNNAMSVALQNMLAAIQAGVYNNSPTSTKKGGSGGGSPNFL